MSLFKCDGCGVVENTALTTGYWCRGPGEPALCSQCVCGEWHGIFPRRTPEECGYVVRNGGVCEPPGGWNQHAVTKSEGAS